MRNGRKWGVRNDLCLFLLLRTPHSAFRTHRSFHSSGCRFDVSGVEEGGDDDDATCTGGEDGGEGFWSDAADAEGGDFSADFAFHGGDFMETDGGTTGFGGGGEKRAEADVVEALGEGGTGLGEGMGGAAEDEGSGRLGIERG